MFSIIVGVCLLFYGSIHGFFTIKRASKHTDLNLLLRIIVFSASIVFGLKLIGVI